MTFTKKIESFTCQQCDKAVTGNGYTNHCPKCLWSKHVDLMPGDRQNACQGLMEPVAVRFIKGEYIIYQNCKKCGYKFHNRASSSDSSELLIALTANPII